MECNRSTKWGRVVSALVVAVLAAGAAVQAQVWQVPMGDWNNPGSWNPPRPPGQWDWAYIGKGGAGVALISGAPTATAGHLYVGDPLGDGTVIQNGGNADFAYLYVGDDEGSTGRYELRGPNSLSVRVDACIGRHGWGEFVQTAGAVVIGTISGGLLEFGAEGSYTMSGGSLSALAEAVGAGRFEQSGGTNSMTALRIGQGSYRLDGGVLRATGGIDVDVYGRLEWFGGQIDQTPSARFGLNSHLVMGYGFNVAGALLDPTFAVNLQLAVLDVVNGAVARHDSGQLAVGSLCVGSDEEAGGYELAGSGYLATGDLFVGELGYCTVTGGSLAAGGLIRNDAQFRQELGYVSAGTFQNNMSVEVHRGSLAAGTFRNAGTLLHAGGTVEAGTFINHGTSMPGMLAAGAAGGAGASPLAGGYAEVRVGGTAVFKADAVWNYTNCDFWLHDGGTIRGKTDLEGTFTNYGSFFMVPEDLDWAPGGSGGTFEDRLINHGYFAYSGGTFNGVLEHWGDWYDFSSPGDFTAGRGIYNYGNLQVEQWRSLRGGGPDGIVNYGQMRLTGGTLGGTKVTNDYGAYLCAKGTIDTDFDNNGELEVDSSLTVTGGTVNRGLIRLENLERFASQGAMSNEGVIELNGGGVLAGPGQITNEYGGVIEMQGGGSITAPMINCGDIRAMASRNLAISSLADNFGIIEVMGEAKLNIPASLVNSGMILLEDECWLGGGAITNTGCLIGCGFVIIGNTVNNQGIIRGEPQTWSESPQSGHMHFTRPDCTNSPSGRIEVMEPATVVFTQGLAANAGTIAVDGGTFDNNARDMTNAGVISGHGTFRMGTLTNEPGGRIGVGDQPTDFYGPLVNSGSVQVLSCTTTFFDRVTNNAGGQIKNTGGTIRFLGGFVNNGAYVSDPADNCFTSIDTGPDGYFVGGGGDRFFISGDFSTASTQNALWDTGQARLTFQGGPRHELDLTGADYGPIAAGYVDNFAWGGLSLAQGQFLALDDGDAAPGGALYLGDLLLAVGAGIDLNGLSLYYRNGGAVKELFYGDADLDGDVDFLDYLTAKANFGVSGGGSWAVGDTDGDADVDFFDYLTVKANFGQVTGGELGGLGAARDGPAPEPGAVGLLALGACAGLLRRSRKE